MRQSGVLLPVHSSIYMPFFTERDIRPRPLTIADIRDMNLRLRIKRRRLEKVRMAITYMPLLRAMRRNTIFKILQRQRDRTHGLLGQHFHSSLSVVWDRR